MSIERVIWDKFKIGRGSSSLPLIAAGTRNNLAELFGELGYKVGAEVGVRKGDFSEVLLKANKSLHLTCIDPWVSYRGKDGTKCSDDRQQSYYDCCKERLSEYSVEFMRTTSQKALNNFPDGCLDFVYLDAIHDFDSTITDIISWSNKVKLGGIVSGHDYVHYYHFGVIEAVNAYTRAHNIFQWYVTSEKEPSWFFQKVG